jgi:hypothetical protein
MLGFLGLTDVEIIRVEGTALGPEAADKAIQRATEQARGLVQARQTLIVELERQRRALAAAA